jgi:hypothetical protein
MTRLPQFKSVTATRQRSQTWTNNFGSMGQYRNPHGLWYLHWHRPIVDFNDGKEVWRSYIVLPPLKLL